MASGGVAAFPTMGFFPGRFHSEMGLNRGRRREAVASGQATLSQARLQNGSFDFACGYAQDDGKGASCALRAPGQLIARATRPPPDGGGYKGG